MQFISGYWLDSDHIQAVVLMIKGGQEYEYLYNIYGSGLVHNKIAKAIADGSLVISEPENTNGGAKKSTRKKT